MAGSGCNITFTVPIMEQVKKEKELLFKKVAVVVVAVAAAAVAVAAAVAIFTAAAAVVVVVVVIRGLQLSFSCRSKPPPCPQKVCAFMQNENQCGKTALPYTKFCLDRILLGLVFLVAFIYSRVTMEVKIQVIAY